MRIFLFLLVILSASEVSGQNPAYECFPEIDSLFEVDYLHGAALWKKHQRKGVVFDPRHRYWLMHYALKNSDIRTFRKQSRILTKKYGWEYSLIDTLSFNRNDPSLAIIYDSNQSQWLLKKSRKWYAHWMKNNPFSFTIQQELKNIVRKDQLILDCLIPILQMDSVQKFSICRDAITEQLYALDLQNLRDILLYCNLYGELPNSFDHGAGTSENVGLIVWHNLKVKANFETSWTLIFPYYEQAYLQGKCDADLFYSYDYWSSVHYGFQVFGMLDRDTPYRSAEETLALRLKYSLQDK